MKKLLFLATIGFTIYGQHEWVWNYNQKIDDFKKIGSAFFYESNKLPDYNQLIFSFNATKPDSGYYSFFVKARNAKSKQWGNWHHMLDWGSALQKTYASKSDGFSSFHHVRLEINDQKSDAYRLKIVPHNIPAILVNKVYITTCDLERFTPESLQVAHLQTKILKSVPCLSQFNIDHPEAARICSPTSCLMLYSVIQQAQIDKHLFIESVYDHGLDTYGSWALNMAAMYEFCKGKYEFCSTRLSSFSDLHRQLEKELPVIVSVRGSLPGAPKPYPNGHLLVVVGWNSRKKAVICHDPAIKDQKPIHYQVTDFVQAWERSHRFSYLVNPINNSVTQKG